MHIQAEVNFKTSLNFAQTLVVEIKGKELAAASFNAVAILHCAATLFIEILLTKSFILDVSHLLRSHVFQVQVWHDTLKRVRELRLRFTSGER